MSPLNALISTPAERKVKAHLFPYRSRPSFQRYCLPLLSLCATKRRPSQWQVITCPSAFCFHSVQFLVVFPQSCRKRLRGLASLYIRWELLALLRYKYINRSVWTSRPCSALVRILEQFRTPYRSWSGIACLNTFTFYSNGYITVGGPRLFYN